MMTTTRPEMVFFDVETTAPSSSPADHQRLLEFGAIVVCPRRLVEVESYHTLIRPADLSAVSKRFSMADDVDVASAPTFEEVADRIFGVLDGRVWAGHNIQRFDCHRIREAFAGIGRQPPEAVAIVDSLNVLAQEFGRRAGDLKMATLASYFGIGKQRHRSLDDARMNLEVLKHCATVLLLESTLPPGMLQGSGAGAGAVTRKRSNGSAGTVINNSVVMTSKRQGSGGKRDSVGRVVAEERPKPKAATTTTTANPKAATTTTTAKPKAATTTTTANPKAATTTTTANPKAATTTTAKPCFHMILRHSRTILR